MRLVIAAVATLLAGEAAAQSCQDYKGKVVNPVAFEEAVKPYRLFEPKGEFETSAEYEKRKKEMLKEAASATLIIGKEPEDRALFEYDADKNRLTIKSFAFENHSYEFASAFHAAELKLRAGGRGNNIGAIISRVDHPRDTYEARTGLGVPVQVMRIERSTQAIFDQEKTNFSWNLFRATEGKYDGVLGHLSMKPDEARSLKPQLKLAYVVRPKDPYHVIGKRQAEEPKLNYPYDVREDFEILIADIRCGLLMDGAGKVLGAWETR